MTTVLVASKDGDTPVATLLREGQSTEPYEKAFKILIQHHPHCINGHKVCYKIFFIIVL